MKKIFITMGILSLTALTACATNTSSQKGLKKSPCACVYQPIPSAENQISDPFAQVTKTVKTGGNVV
ncbi:hypothetical protein AsACE_p200023 (plasmid) [Acinetobacter schindleri]|nr:hypothetical protein AsACE_p200023 [Acinetobacter schindleri]